MGRFATGGVLLGVSIVLRVLNGYQLLEGLLGSLRRHGASTVADALLSNVFLVACGMVGLGLIVDAWRKKDKAGTPPNGSGINQSRSGDGTTLQAGRDIYYNQNSDASSPPSSTSAERYAKEQAEAKARFHESRLAELKDRPNRQISASDPDPLIRVDCRDGREAVLVLTTDIPTKLKAQAHIMSVVGGEIERGDPYPVLWRNPGEGYTTQYQDIDHGKTAVIVLAKATHDAGAVSVATCLELFGDAGVVQVIKRRIGDDTPIQAEISVNIFGGPIGRLVHAFTTS